MLSRLGVLRRAARDYREKACRLASKQALPEGSKYHEVLASLFDNWIRASTGERKIVYLAAAVELGVARRSHFEVCAATALNGKRPDLRILYWTLARRMPPLGMEPGGAPELEQPAARWCAGL